MTQRNDIIYSDRLDTSDDGYTQQQNELAQLFFDYLKIIPISDSNTLIKSRILLKKIYYLELTFTIYEFISLICCLLMIIINSKYNFILLSFGVLLKFILHCKLLVAAKKQRKFLVSKSSLARKIFKNIINKDICSQKCSRIEIIIIDQIVATKINQFLITKQFVNTYKLSIIIIFLITIYMYSYIIYELIIQIKIFNILDKICLSIISIPLSSICLILISCLLVVIFHCLVKLFHEIIIILTNFCTYLPRIVKTIMKNQKNKQCKKNQLKQYLINTLQEQDVCSICLNSFKNIGIQLPCQHLFHFKCIEQWFYLNNSCPICRGRIIETDQAQQK